MAKRLYDSSMKERIRDDFPEYFYGQRIKRGMTQQNVADVIKCSRTFITQWESGDRSPSMEQLEQLSRLFGVDLEELRDKHYSKEEEGDPIYIDVSIFPMQLRKMIWMIDSIIQNSKKENTESD